MSLAVTFRRAASEEFIEASSWYESKRAGLAHVQDVEIPTEPAKGFDADPRRPTP
jgi:hypothetical protein